MNDDEIVWEEPESRNAHGNQRWPGRLQPLMDHPGRWALVRTSPKPETAATCVTYLKRSHHLPGRWEFVSRDLKTYARYLGPDD